MAVGGRKVHRAARRWGVGSGLWRSVDTRSTAPPGDHAARAVGLVPTDGRGRLPRALLLNLRAQAAVDFGELAAVLDAIVGQGEGFLFFPGLQVG